jgi:hypothetical protein
MKNLKIGTQVKVKTGTPVPDSEHQLMDGWQGQVTNIQKEDNIIEIEWDVQTLLDTPYDYLHETISEGYDYELMRLSIDELELATSRVPSDEDIATLNSKIYWIDFYEDKEKDKYYAALFKGINTSDYYQMYEKWVEHLNKHLKFPFDTTVEESERGGLSVGTKVKLLGLDDFHDEMRGVFGIGKSKFGSVTFPICNLEATNKKTKNYGLLRDYVVWFANM